MSLHQAKAVTDKTQYNLEDNPAKDPKNSEAKNSEKGTPSPLSSEDERTTASYTLVKRSARRRTRRRGFKPKRRGRPRRTVSGGSW
ncbi:MAG: hypothetical protein AAFQ63_11825 [Cyanobacteria bacterium J06621_11]